MATQTMGINSGRIERREWFLWSAAVLVTLLLTGGLASFLLREQEDPISGLPQTIQGLIGLVLIFDIYTLYQQLQIHRMRRRLIEGEKLFRLITENAADMIAGVDLEGKGIFNSLSYEKVLCCALNESEEPPASSPIAPDRPESEQSAISESQRTAVGV